MNSPCIISMEDETLCSSIYQSLITNYTFTNGELF